MSKIENERFNEAIKKHGKDFEKYKNLIVFKDGTILNKFFKKIGATGLKGYIYVTSNHKQYLAHRIIWEAFNGKIPDGMQIDHINTIRDDNRLENLKLVSSKENANNPLTKKHMSEGNKGKTNHLKKSIRCCNIKGEFICVFDSITTAAKKIGCSSTTIVNHCNSKKVLNDLFVSFNSF